ncbi:hypothetical protein, variant 3 [Aphanomyces astaci]|uniref:Multiple myeloma tumor-associated protein 2-like N-terminal domain-containing protein n=1 Tax=Aphanomyces astaci TaxID=112090 RepID=W4FY69_APHAT|nr:hypothetical protein, variant 2 [Aphanomyces astaci]XP_009838127.1 hypothetical protein, variant 3 [Aphanomyces astaci]ETV72444.1 hypothetical protein, variant 2 [Aphanomyces astaci]ETV72445.1 hypothetical protein, variant 3 [Aphanomyces astaci]|eukprot:XP_009838126.1 hypothetical protein, variant 2 [Aphanomyces astaci]
MSFGKTNYRFGGTRGGQDQFKWDDVKNDKYRENYLGHSLNAPVGRWVKGKDLTWYSKGKGGQSAVLAEEIALAKQRDEDRMNEALGIAPKRHHEPTGALDANEMKTLLKRGETERNDGDAERVEGLGAATFVTGYEDPTAKRRTMAERYQDNVGKQDLTHGLPGVHNDDEADEKSRKKDAKKQKKMKKEAKKEAKKHKKERKRSNRSPSRERESKRSKRDRSRD